MGHGAAHFFYQFGHQRIARCNMHKDGTVGLAGRRDNCCGGGYCKTTVRNFPKTRREQLAPSVLALAGAALQEVRFGRFHWVLTH